MIVLRKAKDIYQAEGEIENGSFSGRWHFSFDRYIDPRHERFGSLRVFNDDTLSPGAVWPLHPHREIEVVTYCAQGEFRHADEHGKGGILKAGWVQHTTVGSGMFHSEINNSPFEPMRFIQMWFFPQKPGLKPLVEQKKVEKSERTNKLLTLVSADNKDALKIRAAAEVCSCFLEKQRKVKYALASGYGAYVYVLEGGPLNLNNNILRSLDAAAVENEEELSMQAAAGTEILLVSTRMSGILKGEEQ